MSDFRRRLMMNARDPLSISSSKALVGDIALYNKLLNKIVIIPYELVDDNFNKDNYEPIGIVVVPGTHNVYKDNSCGIISLKYMSYTNPSIGTINIEDNGIKLYSGPLFNITKICNYKSSIPYVATGTDFISNSVKGFAVIEPYSDYLGYPVNYSGNIGSDILNPYDKKTKYRLASSAITKKAFSPYNNDDSINTNFLYNEDNNNIFSDFNGKYYSSIITNDNITQTNWKTDPHITNNYDDNTYPASCCCWRYHTLGTKEGDWYLPTMGELIYLVTRYTIINNSANIIKKYFGESSSISFNEVYDSDRIFLSSSVSSDYKYIICIGQFFEVLSFINNAYLTKVLAYTKIII